MKWVHNSQTLLDRRRELRQTQTKAEEILWFELRNNKLGAKFKRQNSIGGYITDFYCQKYKLIVELDGEVHNTTEAKEYDEVRDKFFTSLGYKVLRFPNSEVEDKNKIEEVLEKIKASLV
jgi:very-short-patch-repair endonuclease